MTHMEAYRAGWWDRRITGGSNVDDRLRKALDILAIIKLNDDESDGRATIGKIRDILYEEGLDDFYDSLIYDNDGHFFGFDKGEN